MKEEAKEVAKEVAETMSDYAKAEKEQLVKSIRNMSIMGLAALLIHMVLDILPALMTGITCFGMLMESAKR